MTPEQAKALALARARVKLQKTAPTEPFVPSGEKGIPDHIFDVKDPATIAANPITRFAYGAAEPFLGIMQLNQKVNPFQRMLGLQDAMDPTIKSMNDLIKQGREKIGDEGLDLERTAGNVLSPGNLATAKMPLPKSLPGRMGQGAGIGAAAGGSMPVENTQDYAGEKALQVGGGAVVGGAFPAVSAALSKAGNMGYHGFVEPWANPAAIKGRAYLSAAGDKADEIINLLAQNKQRVPGSAPTAGQAAVPAGRAEFAALQKSAEKVEPSAYLSRSDAQNAARREAVERIAGTQTERNAEQATRKASAGPYYERGFETKLPKPEPKLGNVHKGGEATHWDIDPGAIPGEPQFIYRDQAAVIEHANGRFSAAYLGGKPIGDPKGYNTSEEARAAVEAFFQKHPMDGFKGLIERPSMKAAIKRAEQLIKERTGTVVKLGGSGHSLSGREAQDLKLAFDDMVKHGKKSGIETAELTALLNTRKAYVDWMEESFPDLKAGREAYKAGSQRINQMDVGETLKNKLVPALSDEAKQRSTVFAEAVRNAPSTLKKATGEPRFSQMDEVLTPRQLRSVGQVQDDLANTTRFEDMAKRGSGSADATHMATANLEQQAGGKMPNLLHRGAMLANAIISRLEGKVNRELAAEMAVEMLDPPTVANSLRSAKASDARNKQLVEAILRQMRPALAGTAAASVSQGE